MSAATDVPLVTLEDVAKMLDATFLQPFFTTKEIADGCRIARKENVASVCVRPCDVALAKTLLDGSTVNVGTVIGFPHGTTTTVAKVAESIQAISDGAVELDMVINIGYVKSGRLEEAQADVKAVVDAAVERGAIVKVILENAYLSNEEKVAACKACEAAGAHFVKTSTGYAPSGSNAADLRLMRATVSPSVRVKAAGGIRTLDAVLEARACGAVRCGCSAAAAILAQFRERDPEGKGLPLPVLEEGKTAISGGY